MYLTATNIRSIAAAADIMQKITRIIGFVITTAWLVTLMQSSCGVSALKNLPDEVAPSSRMLDAKTLLTRRKRYVFFTPGSAVQVIYIEL